ncbi:MAG: hypothetical protein AAGD11_03350 [Planctomycetota bacterium]
MPIQVTCPSCHARFKVGDQHAGKTGPCPKCNKPIKIPDAGDEVVIHAPEVEAGAKDATGKNVLKPIKRKETKISLNVSVATVGLVLLSIAIAWMLGGDALGDQQIYALAGGAVFLGPLLAYAGYTFLRDDELGVFDTTSAVIRSVACGFVYALLWGVYIFLGTQVFGDEAFEQGLEMVQIVGLGVVSLGIGTFAAFVSYDFEPINGFFHYMLYLLVTILLRAVMGLPFIPGMGVTT